MTPLISIIIPTFNRAHLIEDTLNSIKNQTFESWECIVVDDGSDDHTEKLLNRWVEEDNRFRYLNRPASYPKGANSCRNYGFSLSKGNFINWFDSDDLMMENKLELQIKSLENHPDAPYCICQSSWFNKDRNEDLGLRSQSITSKTPFEDYVLQRIVWLTTAPLWRRTFIEKNQLEFDIHLHQSQEYDFNIRALAINSNYSVVNEPLVTIIQHKDSISEGIYHDYEKMVSNVSVKKMIFNEYRHHLTDSGLIKLYEMLTISYKNVLPYRKFKVSLLLVKQLFSSVKYVKASMSSKIAFLFRVILALISYQLFGKGYNLVTPLTEK